MLTNFKHLQTIRLWKQYLWHFQLPGTLDLPQLPRQKNKNLSRHLVIWYHFILDDILAISLSQKRRQIQRGSLASHKIFLGKRIPNKLRCDWRVTFQNNIDCKIDVGSWSYQAYQLDPIEVISDEELQSPRTWVYEHQPFDHKFHPHNLTVFEDKCSYQQEL